MVKVCMTMSKFPSFWESWLHWLHYIKNEYMYIGGLREVLPTVGYTEKAPPERGAFIVLPVYKKVEKFLILVFSRVTNYTLNQKR